MESKVSRGLGGTCSLNRGKTDPVGRGGKRGRKRESFRERDSTFSLNFPTIGPWFQAEQEEEVQPYDKGFA